MTFCKDLAWTHRVPIASFYSDCRQLVLQCIACACANYPHAHMQSNAVVTTFISDWWQPHTIVWWQSCWSTIHIISATITRYFHFIHIYAASQWTLNLLWSSLNFLFMSVLGQFKSSCSYNNEVIMIMACVNCTLYTAQNYNTIPIFAS